MTWPDAAEMWVVDPGGEFDGPSQLGGTLYLYCKYGFWGPASRGTRRPHKRDGPLAAVANVSETDREQ